MTARRLFALLFLVITTCLFAAGDLRQASADDKDKQIEKTKDKDKEFEKIKEMPKPQPNPLQELLDKNKALIPALVAALRDGDPEVRQTTAYTLVNLGKEAVPALTAALGDKDRELRANAAIVLGQFGKLAQEALPALLQAMKDEDPEVRRRVIYAISRIVEASSGAAAREGRNWWEAPVQQAATVGMAVPVGPRPRDPGLLLKALPPPRPLPPLERY